MVFKEVFYDKQVDTMKKVLIVWILLVCFLLTGCTSQGESTSSRRESSQGTAVSTASEALESWESADQDNSSSDGSTLVESSPSRQEEDSSSLEPASQSQDGETSQPEKQQGLTLADLSSAEGDFTYLGLEYGTPDQVVLPFFGLSGAEPDREWETSDSGLHSEYRTRAMDLGGVSFGLTLGFLDGLLNSFTFTWDAQEGKDLTSLYEDLRVQLESLYGLPEEETVLEDVLAVVDREKGKTVSYDRKRFSFVVEEEGERATRMYLSLMERDGAGVQVELSLNLYQ